MTAGTKALGPDRSALASSVGCGGAFGLGRGGGGVRVLTDAAELDDGLVEAEDEPAEAARVVAVLADPPHPASVSAPAASAAMDPYRGAKRAMPAVWGGE